MSDHSDIIWSIEPHTIAKHLILQKYLEAWFPILSRWNSRIVYYDGFAGPGEYSGGKDGSPIIALNVARQHRADFDSELVFVFVEERTDRADHLRKRLESLAIPDNFRWDVRNEEFAKALSSTLDYLDKHELKIAPTFAFIDPFGIKGLPFTLIERLLAREKCEVLITFMNHTIERFVTELPENVNDLIGNECAAEIIANASDRILQTRKLYAESLQRVARFVRFFEMRNVRNRPIYDLFFATNNKTGHYKMKEAMWKADDSGEYSFSDGVDPAQTILFSDQADEDCAKILVQKFAGKEVCSDEVLSFVRNSTPYLEKHARESLKLLEEEKKIEVADTKVNGKRRRRNTYPSGILITFRVSENRL